ncbi:transposase [Streptomyces sp. NPDC056650]|uniref:transposase n=1 Tax=Streptomyces sp. NPDC056650 TaxID=3154856 RepID=UPI003419C48D
MGRGDLTDAEWERLRPFLPVSNRRCGRWRDHRQVIDGILFLVTPGERVRGRPDTPAVTGPQRPFPDHSRRRPRPAPASPGHAAGAARRRPGARP